MVRSMETNHEHVEDTAEKRRNFAVAIFGTGGQEEKDLAAIEKARQLASGFVSKGFSINTGGYGGVMKAASEAGKEAADLMGVSEKDYVNAYVLEGSSKLSARETASANKVREKSYAKRLAGLIDQSKAYIVLSGGQGTVIELFAALESERINRLVKEDDLPKPV